MSTPPPPTFGLSLKLALFASVVAVVPLLGVGWAVVEVNRSELKQQSLLLHASIAEGVDAALLDALGRTRDLTRAAATLLGDGELEEESRLKLLLALLAGAEVGTDAAVYAADGALIDVVRTPRSSRSVFPERFAPADLAALSAASGAGPSPDIALVVGAPIGGDNGGPARGFVVVPVPAAIAAQHLRRLSETAGDAIEEVVVLGKTGEMILSSRAEGGARAAEELAILDDLDLAVTDKPITRHGPFMSRGGVPMFGSVIARPRAGWTVIAQTPQAVAYRSLGEVRAAVAKVAVAAILLALAAALALSRQLTRPLRALMGMVRALGERRYDARAEVNTRDELATLGHTLNTAAAELAESEARLREEAAIRQDLGRYIDQSVVERVVAREQSMDLGGTRAHIAVLFVDVVAFTPLTERLPPETVVALLNELFTFLTELVFKHGGTLDKFIGDGLMAIFGAPVAHEDVEARALACAEEMLTWLDVGNAKWENAHGVRIQLAIGVHAGAAVVGNIGSDARMEYTAIGETVNIAARLESSARPGQILTTRAVVEACPDTPVHALGPQHFAGMAEPLETYAVDLLA